MSQVLLMELYYSMAFSTSNIFPRLKDGIKIKFSWCYVESFIGRPVPRRGFRNQWAI